MSDSPIFIVGPPRCGNTWMQHALSRHPDCTIYGHFPKIDGSKLAGWLAEITESGRLAAQWNEAKGYEVPHFAGGDAVTCRLALGDMLETLWTEDEVHTPRWGASLKWGQIELYKSLWPPARFVVCLRDPFKAYESAVNNFNKKVDAVGFLANWTAAAQFAHTSDAPAWRTDLARDWGPQRREDGMKMVLDRCGLSSSESVLEFAREYSVVHKLKPDHEWTHHLPADEKARLHKTVPGLAECMERMGYAR